MITLPAYAKINLVLEILGKRDDGYHELSSVFQTIELMDTISFTPSDEIEFRCNIPDLISPQNSVLKAARLLQQETGYSKGASIYLHNRIPIGGGLGGHSSDGAATLRGLNQLWELGLSTQSLLQLAAMVSSDAPFFLYGGTALVQGHGERVTPLPPLSQAWIVLLTPVIKPIPNKTARLYASLNHSHFTSGQLSQRFVNQLERGESVQPWLLFNAFELAAFDLFPNLNWHRSRFLAAGAETVHLAGAGPTLFTIVSNRERGETITCQLRKEGHQVYLACTIGAETSLCE
jgi:4-diphosphocytidyl-2-C-methyl-D-erythritol kinase